MDVALTLREARTAAHLTQRQLAARAGVPQSTVARIERGHLMPRVDLFDDLLRAADRVVSTAEIPGAGVDRTLIRQNRALSPRQRAEQAAYEANQLAKLLASARRT